MAGTITSDVVVETDRLSIRSWRPEDQAFLHSIMSDPEVMRCVWDYKPATHEQVRDFIESCIEDAKERGWSTWPVTLRDDQSLIGYCGFLVRTYGEYSGQTEIGWLIAREHWGKGFATEAAKATINLGFSRWGFNRVIASARAENTQSVRVMVKAGMSLIGDSLNPRGRLVPHAVIKNEHLHARNTEPIVDAGQL